MGAEEINPWSLFVGGGHEPELLVEIVVIIFKILLDLGGL